MVLQASVLLLLLLLLHHLLVVIRCTSRFASLVFSALVVLIVVALVGEVLWSLVFVRGAILCTCQYPSGYVRDVMRNLRIGTW